VLVLAGVATAAQAGDETSRAAAVLKPFKQQLQQALREGLAEGPVEAIGACRLRAPEIAASLSKDGVRVGRTSHKLRNPANASPSWVAPVLARYLAEPKGARTPSSVALPDGRSGYVEPIVTQPLCLTCHGESIAPALAARIRALYPEDRATGFREGDLRGVFWVELPARRRAE
jgi:hypothetical protein